MGDLAKRKLALIELILNEKDEAVIAALERMVLPGYKVPDQSSEMLKERLEEYNSSKPKAIEEVDTDPARSKSWVDELYGSARFTDEELAGDERLQELVNGARTKSTYRAKSAGSK